MAEKILAFKVTEEMGAQYINTAGHVINVPKDAIVTNADVDTMYVTKVINGKNRKHLKYGWEEIKNYLPPATPVDVKVAESKRIKELSDENIRLKAKIDEQSSED